MRFTSSSLRRALMGATAAVVMAGGANAAIDVSIGINTTGQPTYNSPTAGTPSAALSGVFTNFVAAPFQVDTAGVVQIDNIAGTNADPFLSLYTPSFDPANALLNNVQTDDDGAGGFNSRVSQALTGGTQYIAVGDSVNAATFGTSTLRFTGAAANVLTINGDLSSFVGPVTIANGVLELGAGGSLGTADITNPAVLGLNSPANVTVANSVFGNGFIIKLGANTATLTGATIENSLDVQGGTVFRNGTIRGDVFVQPGATLAGNVTVGAPGFLNNLTNNGTLSAGNSPGSIVVFGNYFGGGAITQEVQFQNAATSVNGVTHDHLFVGNNYIGATTTVNVVDLAPVGAATATVGNGIEIARFGTAAAGDLRLGNRSFSGGFEYFLTFVPNFALGTIDGFFLQSAAREELSLNAVILSASRNHVRNTYVNAGGDVHEADWGQKGRFWVSGMFQSTQAGANSGVRHNLDDWSVSGGFDHEITPNFRLGLKGSYGNTEGDVWVRQGALTVDGDTWSILGTAHYVHGGFYADLSAGYAMTDWDVRRAQNPGGLLGTFGVASNVDVDGIVGHLDAGYRIKTDDIFTLTFAGQVFYNDMDCGTNCLFAAGGLPQSVEDTSDWVGRLEAKLEAAYGGGKYRPWVAVNYTDTLDGDGQTVRMGNAVVTSETANNLLGVDLGLQAQIATNLDLTIQAGMQHGTVDDVQTYQGQLGLRYRW